MHPTRNTSLTTVSRRLQRPLVIGLLSFMLMAMFLPGIANAAPPRSTPAASHHATTPTVGAQSASYRYALAHSPLSPGLVMARAFHAGQLHLTGHAAKAQAHPALTCSPAPCVLPPVQASEGGQPVNSTPIAANPSNPNDLLSAGTDYNCPSLTGVYASSDGGATWNHTCMNTLAGYQGCGIPSVGYDLHNVAYLTGIDCPTSGTAGAIALEKSTDNGLTWSAPILAVNSILGGLTDSERLQIDVNPKSPHANSLYISATQFDSSGMNSEISLSRSSNGGATWTTGPVDSMQIYPNIDQFSNVATEPKGPVDVAWIRCTANGPTGNCGGTTGVYWYAQSKNGGLSWGKLVLAVSGGLAPDTCGAFYGCLPNTNEPMYYLPWIIIVNMGSFFCVYIVIWVYFPCYGYFRIIIFAFWWFRWWFLSPSPNNHDQFYASASVSSKGVIGVTWLDRRNDPNNVSYQEFAAFSKNGGKSFGKSIPLTTAMSNPNNDGFGGSYMGRSTGSAWAGNTMYASWMDSSNGTNMQDIVGGYQSSKVDQAPATQDDQLLSTGSSPTPPSAVHTHIAKTRAGSPQAPLSNLVYHNGPVMTGMACVYAIFWEPTGSYVSPTYNSLIKRYFGDVGGSGLYHNNTQYPDTSTQAPQNAMLAGSWVDTAAYPANPISDAQVQAEVTHAQAVNGWPWFSSMHNIFFVFTARGENICASFGCSFQVFCAYHGFFGANTIYAAMPYTGTNLAACGVPKSPNSDFDADSTINVTSHEQMEAATDPLLNAWYDSSGSEIGDKCAWNFGAITLDGGNANVQWNTHFYIVQQEWDNLISACTLSGP